MSRFVRGLFQTARTISTIDPTAPAERPGGRLPHGGCLLHGATLVRLCDCVLACRVVSRGHVLLYAIVAVRVVATSCPGRRARRGRPSCRSRGVPGCGCGRAVAVASAVFPSPSCGCDTPTNASVCNGLCGVCVVLVCYLTG